MTEGPKVQILPLPSYLNLLAEDQPNLSGKDNSREYGGSVGREIKEDRNDKEDMKKWILIQDNKCIVYYC